MIFIYISTNSRNFKMLIITITVKLPSVQIQPKQASKIAISKNKIVS